MLRWVSPAQKLVWFDGKDGQPPDPIPKLQPDGNPERDGLTLHIRPLNDKTADARQRKQMRQLIADLDSETFTMQALEQPKKPPTLKGHTEGLYSLAFSPDGKTLASCGSDSTIRLWDASTGKEMKSLKSKGVIHRLDCRPKVILTKRVATPAKGEQREIYQAPAVTC
jgi:WD40 repeat protein